MPSHRRSASERSAAGCRPRRWTRSREWWPLPSSPPPRQVRSATRPGLSCAWSQRAEGPPSPAVGEETELAALDQAIAEAAAGALEEPVAAIVAEARHGDDGPVLALTTTGTEPFRLLLFASDIPGYSARTWIDTPAGQQHLDVEAVERLVAAGTIPDGPADLPPGSEAVIPLPAGAEAGSTGGFIVWRAGQGHERRIVTGSWSLPAPGTGPG